MLALTLTSEVLADDHRLDSGWLWLAGMTARPRATSSRTSSAGTPSRAAMNAISAVMTRRRGPAAAGCRGRGPRSTGPQGGSPAVGGRSSRPDRCRARRCRTGRSARRWTGARAGTAPAGYPSGPRSRGRPCCCPRSGRWSRSARRRRSPDGTVKDISHCHLPTPALPGQVRTVGGPGPEEWTPAALSARHRRELPRLCSCPPDDATRGNEPQAADDVSAHAASDDTAHVRLVQAWWIRLEGVRAVAAPNTSAVGVMRPEGRRRRWWQRCERWLRARGASSYRAHPTCWP